LPVFLQHPRLLRFKVEDAKSLHGEVRIERTVGKNAEVLPPGPDHEEVQPGRRAGLPTHPVPQDRYYRIGVPPVETGAPVFEGVLELDRLSAEGLTSGRAIVYSDSASPDLVQEYFYDYWVEPPSVMVRDALIAYLRRAGVAEAVVSPEVRAEANYTLAGRIDRMELVRGPEPKGVIDIELAITNARTGKLVMINSYALGVQAADNSVAAGIAAIDQGMAAVFERFLQDIRAAR